jgi:nucleoside-diphosphate-sugar epimerase
MREVYVEGLRRTLERLPKPGRFVYVSSTGVYGDAGGAWVNEDSPTAPTDQGGEVCLEAEGVVRDFGAANAVDWNVCRLAGIYGPGRMIGAEGLRRGEPVAGRPDGWLNLIHRDDAVLALLAVGERGASNRVYNLADDHPTLRREFYRTLAERLRVAEPTFAPERARRHRGDRRVDASRIKRELGLSWLYPSFRDALPELLAPNLPR